MLKTSETEKKIASIIGRTLGGKINLVPIVLYSQNIQTPDYIINNKKFDLKQVQGNGKNTLDTAVSKKKRQSDNFIFYITNAKMDIEQALLQIDKIYDSKNRSWINTIIMNKRPKNFKNI